MTIDVDEGGKRVQRKINLVVNGKLIQDTDFNGNGNEGGTVTVTGDYNGTVISRIVLTDKLRGGGSFDAACSSDPFGDKSALPVVPPSPSTSPTGAVAAASVPSLPPDLARSPTPTPMASTMRKTTARWSATPTRPTSTAMALATSATASRASSSCASSTTAAA